MRLQAAVQDSSAAAVDFSKEAIEIGPLRLDA